MDQRRFVEASSARFHTNTSIDNMAEEIAEAFYAARVHRGPVVLNLPKHLQEVQVGVRLSSVDAVPAHPRRNDGGRAPRHHRRPRCHRGEREGRDYHAGRPRGRAARDLAAGQGIVRRSSVGCRHADTFASAPSEELLAEADFVLGVGAEFGYYTTETGLLFPSAEIARIDIRPMPDEIGVIPGLYVQADARRAVIAINEALEARQVRKEGLRTAATRTVLDAPPHRFEAPADGVDPRALAGCLGVSLPPPGPVIAPPAAPLAAHGLLWVAVRAYFAHFARWFGLRIGG